MSVYAELRQEPARKTEAGDVAKVKFFLFPKAAASFAVTVLMMTATERSITEQTMPATAVCLQMPMLK